MNEKPRRAIVKNSIASKYIRVVSFGSRTCFVHETNLVVILMFCVMFLFHFAILFFLGLVLVVIAPKK